MANKSRTDSKKTLENPNLVDTKGNLLWKYLEQKGLTNTDLSRLSELNLATIAKVLKQKRVRRGTILKISKALEVTPDIILPSWERQNKRYR